MHRIRELALRCQHQNITGPDSMEAYINSPKFWIKQAADALFSAHFGPKDLRHTNLGRAARFRAKALAAKQGVVTAKIRHIPW